MAPLLGGLVATGIVPTSSHDPHLNLTSKSSTMIAQDDAIDLKVGEFGSVELEKGEKKDFRIDLAAGSYIVYFDCEAIEHKINAELDFLKKNGAEISGLTGDKVRVNGDYFARSGRTLTLKANTSLRLRLKNEDDGDGKFWIKIVPAKQTEFVKFGFKKEIKPAKVDSEKGVGGYLKTGQVVYYSAEIPAGKWSYSVGVSSRKGQGTVLCTAEMLDEKGFQLSDRNIFRINPDLGEARREESILKFIKPKKVIIRVEADIITGEGFDYDVTIRKETGN
jgi:hypothetical protein